MANQTFAAVRFHLEQKRNNIDIACLQREWDEIRKEREQEARTMAKLADGLKRALKSIVDSGKLDKLMEYLTEQLRALREANRNQGEYFESLTQKLADAQAPRQDETLSL